jgi:hypothetical protein
VRVGIYVSRLGEWIARFTSSESGIEDGRVSMVRKVPVGVSLQVVHGICSYPSQEAR